MSAWPSNLIYKIVKYYSLNPIPFTKISYFLPASVLNQVRDALHCKGGAI